MNKFETVLILDPDKDNKTIKKYIESKLKLFTSWNDKNKKIIIDEDIGKRKLAYKMKDKYEYGRYIIFKYYATAENTAELARILRIEDIVLKFITMRMDDDEDIPEKTKIIIDDIDDITETEQDSKPDALDVILGLAEYNIKKGVK